MKSAGPRLSKQRHFLNTMWNQVTISQKKRHVPSRPQVSEEVDFNFRKDKAGERKCYLRAKNYDIT